MFDAKTRVLVADDMMTMRKVVAKNCKDIGFTDIIEASDGADAWKKISEANPPIGLVISDWNMPNMTGLELLKKIRGDAKLAKTPVMLVTAESEKSQIEEAIKSGVDGYVIKPFTPQTLRDKLEAIHKRRGG